MATPGVPRPGNTPPYYNPSSVTDGMQNLQINQPTGPRPQGVSPPSGSPYGPQARPMQPGQFERTMDQAPQHNGILRQHLMNLIFGEDPPSQYVLVRAKYNEFAIQFYLPFTAGIEALKEKVAVRLDLGPNTFTLHYHEDNGVLTWITVDEDLATYLTRFNPLVNPIIVRQMTNF